MLTKPTTAEKPTIYAGRVQVVRVRALRNSRRVELDVDGQATLLTPIAARAVIKRMQAGLAMAEGR